MVQIAQRWMPAFFLWLFLFSTHSALAQQLSLNGTWRFALDREDKGIKEKWMTQNLTETVVLPGSMLDNRKGDEVTLATKWTGSIYDSSFFFRPSLAKYRQPDHLKIPFWLTPLKHYVGVAWYQKDIVIPNNWQKKRIKLFLERAHITTKVWYDHQEIGSQNSLSVPHEYDLSPWATPGRHTLTIRIDNRINEVNVGQDSHSVSDHTQGNWNGIVGNLFLQATDPVFIEDIQVYPDVTTKTARVQLRVLNQLDKEVKGTVAVSAQSFNARTSRYVMPVSASVQLSAGDTSSIEVVLPMGEDVLLWDEFNPALYMLTATLTAPKIKDERQQQFGMREFKTEGTQFLINGRPVFLRGTVNNCEFPLTGYPAMDVKAWERIFSIARAHGLNHMRFHSWCPPEAAFIAADKLGFYLQPEAPTWPNHGTSLGDGRFIDQYIYEETNRMAKAYGNHASFCMLAAGNEPAGRNQAKYLAGFIQYWQAKDKRRVYTGASVAMSWPLVPENEYMIKSGARGLNWDKQAPESQSDYRAAIEPFKVPYVTHEMGQWCVFPNFKEIKKYTGNYRARNFELFQEDLKDHGMANQAEDFLMASGKLQALCYKYEIEKTLRTQGLAGFQLLGLQDFPGQGSAIVGTLDAFWDEKGYITAKEWSRFCNAIVPLSRIPKFVFTNNETFTADIELFNYGKSPLHAATFTYTLKDEDGKIWDKGYFATADLPIGNGLPVGKISFPLQEITQPKKMNLEVKMEHTAIANDWNFWVYPQKIDEHKTNIYYTDTLDAQAEHILQSGGAVFLNAAGKVVKGKEVVMYFTPVFWNTSWFKMRPPHVTGMLINDHHPVFDNFPTHYYSDVQWWSIANRAQVMNLEDFPKGFKPLVQPIDTWFMNRRLALLFEAKVGKGKLMVCSADLLSDTTHRPAARQLLYSIDQYMMSEKFQPKETVEISVVKDLFKTPSKEQWDSFTKDSPDELKPKK